MDTRDPHSQAEELLPWYATGQLEGDELALVEQHLSGCAYCRRQLTFERRMVEEFTAMTPEVDSGWARLKQRLEAPAPQEPTHAPAPHERWRDKVANDAAALWQTVSRPAIAARPRRSRFPEGLALSPSSSGGTSRRRHSR